MADSYRAIFRDAARQAVAVVKPHATLDNAIKVATIADTVARTVATIANLPKPPPVGPLKR